MIDKLIIPEKKLILHSQILMKTCKLCIRIWTWLVLNNIVTLEIQACGWQKHSFRATIYSITIHKNIHGNPKNESPSSKAKNFHLASLQRSDCTLALMSAYEIFH